MLIEETFMITAQCQTKVHMKTYGYVTKWYHIQYSSDMTQQELSDLTVEFEVW